MDAAAKALLIAGGILIGVLIISLSMYFYTSFQDAYNRSSDIHSAYQKQLFNSEFTKYDNGTAIKGYEVYNLLTKASEIVNDENAMVYPFTVSGDVVSGADIKEPKNIRSYFFFSEYLSKLYDYSYEYNSEGLINKITINSKSA